MNAKKAKSLRKQISNWRGTIYQPVQWKPAFANSAALKPSSPIRLHVNCGRAQYQAAKKAA